MTRKDYIRIARAIRAIDDTLIGSSRTTDTVLKIVDQLCYELAEENPNFNRETFRKAALHQPV